MEPSTSTTQLAAAAPLAAPAPLLRLALQARARVLTVCKKLDWLALLLARLAVGLLFLSTGWGKVHDLDKVSDYFVSLHIPFPAFNAVLVAYSELICGAALTVGLLSRLATVPLIVSMVVAIITARSDDVSGLLELVAVEEFTYLVLLVMIAILGPGRLALDHVLASKIDRVAQRAA